MEAKSTMICLDTSRWMRSNRSVRFKNQADAIQLYITNILRTHVKNEVGVFGASAGYTRPLISPCRDLQRIMDTIYSVSIVGPLRLINAIDSAHLGYVYKAGMPIRIAAFAGGNLCYTDEFGIQFCGQMIKEKNVSLDVVNFGKLTKYKRVCLEMLVDAANNNNGNTRILHVPRGSSVRDALSKFIRESNLAPLGSLSMQEESATLKNLDHGENLDPHKDMSTGVNKNKALRDKMDALFRERKEMRLRLEERINRRRGENKEIKVESSSTMKYHGENVDPHKDTSTRVNKKKALRDKIDDDERRLEVFEFLSGGSGGKKVESLEAEITMKKDKKVESSSTMKAKKKDKKVESSSTMKAEKDKKVESSSSMKAETTMITMDTSKWMKMDFDMTRSKQSFRLKQQIKVIELYITERLESHIGNLVAVCSECGAVLVRPSRDLEYIMSSIRAYCYSSDGVGGTLSLVDMITVACMMVISMQTVDARVRLAVFVGGIISWYPPIDIGKCAEAIKSHNQAFDIVNFGDQSDDKWELLDRLVATAKSNGNCRLLHVPRGSTVLSDSRILHPRGMKKKQKKKSPSVTDTSATCQDWRINSRV